MTRRLGLDIGTNSIGWCLIEEEGDKSRIDPKGAGTSMYIHRGGADTVLEPNTWSAGCQTVPKNRYPTFLKAVGKPNAFYYVLVNAAS